MRQRFGIRGKSLQLARIGFPFAEYVYAYVCIHIYIKTLALLHLSNCWCLKMSAVSFLFDQKGTFLASQGVLIDRMKIRQGKGSHRVRFKASMPLEIIPVTGVTKDFLHSVITMLYFMQHLNNRAHIRSKRYFLMISVFTFPFLRKKNASSQNLLFVKHLENGEMVMQRKLKISFSKSNNFFRCTHLTYKTIPPVNQHHPFFIKSACWD